MTRSVACLVLGLAAGIAIGWFAFHEPATPPRAQTPQVAAPAPPESTVPREPLPLPPAEPARPAPERDHVAPVAPQADLPPEAEVEEGRGRIEIDFGDEAASRDVGFEVATLGGKRDVWTFSAQGGLAWEDVPPGEYLPFWTPADRLGRWGARVRVEAGCVTRVRADDASLVFELPMSAGTGWVDVEVRTAAGVALPEVEVVLEGSGSAGPEQLEGWTNREGWARLECLPGPCTVRVGGRSVPATVVAGQRVEIRARPEGEGDLLFEMPANSPRLAIRPPGQDVAVPSVWWAGQVAGRPVHGLFFVPAGEYEVCWRLQTTLPPIGKARVRARQVTVFEGPPGGIEVLLTGFEERQRGQVTVSTERLEGATWRHVALVQHVALPESDDGDLVRRIPFLPRGTYRVQAEAAGLLEGIRRTEQAVVEVGDGWTDVHLRLAPAR
jgi:hypothetical protein